MAETGCAKTEVTTSKQMMTNISVSMPEQGQFLAIPTATYRCRDQVTGDWRSPFHSNTSRINTISPALSFMVPSLSRLTAPLASRHSHIRFSFHPSPAGYTLSHSAYHPSLAEFFSASTSQWLTRTWLRIAPAIVLQNTSLNMRTSIHGCSLYRRLRMLRP